MKGARYIYIKKKDPCMLYLPTFTRKIYQMTKCRKIYHTYMNPLGLGILGMPRGKSSLQEWGFLTNI